MDSGGEPLDRDCARCKLSAGPGKSCLQADGTPGGLLVVGDNPVRDAARPFASKVGAFVRDLVARSWSGPVVYDYALKCPAGALKGPAAAKAIKECRPYLAEVVSQASPTRVLALGPWAAQALLGRSVDANSTRRGYGWVLGSVPVFLLPGPQAVMHNRFLKRRFEADVAHCLTTPTPVPTRDGVVHVVEDWRDAIEAEAALADFGELLLDVETAGVPHGPDFTILCAGLSPVDAAEGDAWVWSAAALVDVGATAILRRLLKTRKISGSNVKYDLIAASQYLGIDITDVGFDTQIIRKLLDPTAYGRLDYVAELVGMGGSKVEADELRKKAKAAVRRKKWRPGDPDPEHWCVRAIKAGGEADRYSFGLLPEEVLWRYNGRDAVISAAGSIHLRAEVAKQPGELGCWDQLYARNVSAFSRIERVGIAADRQAFESFSRYLQTKMGALRQRFKAYGEDFNPDSPVQVAKVLFDKLRLPKGEVSEKTGAPSTNAATLENLKGAHPFVDDMLEWRTLAKMDGTYAAGMIPHIRPDGRVHPWFKLDGTGTGRISSEDPNSQNQPRAETLEGKMCRDCFVAAPGKLLLELDQSQVELRVAAGMSGDPEMIDIFKSGLDYHLRTAQLIAKVAWGILEDAITDWHRSHAKIVNFSLVYGKTDATLAKEIGCTVDEARKIRLAILGRFKKLRELLDRLIAGVRRNGYVEVPWSVDAFHRRPLPEAGSQDRWKVQNAENAAMNTPIQGRAAWYALAAIPLIHDWIDDNAAPAEIVNTVHDSIMIEVEPEAFDEVADAAATIMESFDCWGVPLVVDRKAGLRWGSLRKIKRGEKLKDAEVRWTAEALKEARV